MHYRYRFEDAGQLFRPDNGDIIILPLKELLDNPGVCEKYGSALYCEIPAIVYPEKEEQTADRLCRLKKLGLEHAVCENIGSLSLSRDAGLIPHGGMFLNIMNSVAAEEYTKLGFADITMSMELSFANYRKMKLPIPSGFVIYGYLPLMKFRVCPLKNAAGCKGCMGKGELTDRKGEHFTVLCRGREYQELLNCVPLYAADKFLPEMDFRELYFTGESGSQCKSIAEMVKNNKIPDFRRTNGLYYRDLL